MPVGLALSPALPIAGIRLAAVAAGIKRSGTDLVLISLPETSRSAAVLTRNAFCAAPVHVCREHLASNAGQVRALLINSGNANAGTGKDGIRMAKEHCVCVAERLGVPSASILPFSTGVIGEPLPDDRMREGIERAVRELDGDWLAAARGIMTTDTVPKLSSRQCEVGGRQVTLTGMAKGAGMIQPNMATMLAYLFADIAVETEHLHELLTDVVATSFNAITVDSDSSTNDACVLSATGAGPLIDPGHPDWPQLHSALAALSLELAQALVRDAEGATKFITVTVEGGRHRGECRRVAYAIANSPLVKTAMFASDANVGRLLMAIGKADIAALDPGRVTVSLGDLKVFEREALAPGYSEEQGAAAMAEDEITVSVDLGRGKARATVYTSDLSHDYVSINAGYRS